MARNYHLSDAASACITTLSVRTGLPQTHLLSQSLLFVSSLLESKQIEFCPSDEGMTFVLKRLTSEIGVPPVELSVSQGVAPIVPASSQAKQTPSTSEAPRQKTVVERWADDDDAILNPTKPKAPPAQEKSHGWLVPLDEPPEERLRRLRIESVAEQNGISLEHPTWISIPSSKTRNEALIVAIRDEFGIHVW